MSDDKAKALDKAHDRFSKAKKNELPKEDAYFKALHVLREKEEALRAHPTDARRRARDEAEASCNKAQAEYDAATAERKSAAAAYDDALRARWDERIDDAGTADQKKEVAKRELDQATTEHDQAKAALSEAKRKLQELEADLKKETDAERREDLRERIAKQQAVVDRAADEEKRTEDNRKNRGGK